MDGDLEARVVAIVRDVGGFPAGLIHPGTRFHEDIGADSLDELRLVRRCEEAFGVAFPQENLEQIRTVGQLAQYFKDRIQ